MSDTSPAEPPRPARPVRRVTKKAAARARAELTDALEADTPIPADDEVFVIEPIIDRYRYMFAGGRIMDVTSPYQSNSTDREKVLKEAQRRWGGKKDDWRIEGSTRLTIDES